MSGVRVEVLAIDRYERPYRLRMPFRFGVTTATHGRQTIVRARIRLADGRETEGFSAEALGAKWFDKNLALTDAQNHHQLRKALELASDAYLGAGAATPFDLFAGQWNEVSGPLVHILLHFVQVLLQLSATGSKAGEDAHQQDNAGYCHQQGE